MEKYFTYFMDALTDIISSWFNPIKTQNKLRELQQQAEEKDAQISDLRRDLELYRRRYYSHRDLLADAVFERLQIDEDVTDVRFGTEKQVDIDGTENVTAVNAQIYVRHKKGGELFRHSAKGEDHVDALVELYKHLKNSDIDTFTNAEFNS